ncbi:zinc-binding dehydrogenase [Streptomyces sp. 35G-GA-8]|uniref:zinc-binding dehydrogenase n=1 Tax=Streptomyces sp. 35G-GA-8 TaxID=2939434 RepID=UPI00201EB42C|nr:zinc-binding dehydrogenase [Streptomyces sp. 35G-GA-8]MCL7380258.1 zinc-binding dehydrogenase [Streptomyces sp. 35G-GA-8]
MHAIRLHAFGPAENLVHELTEDPVPAPGQVRIAVAAAGVHLLDTALREGMQGPSPAPAELPTIPGREVAGTVESLGEGVDTGWLGKHVVAHLGMVPGGYAELAVTDTARLHEIPAGLDAAEAVAMIGTGRTTMGILQFTDLGPDDIVLVPAAAGGIGTLLVQYAKNADATVIGLAGGAAKVTRVAENGADLAVDYTRPDWPERVRDHLRDRLGDRRATVLFDSVGGATGLAAVDLLGKGGKHIVFGWSGEGLHDGKPLTFTDEELTERGITSESVLGPVMIAKAGGDVRALEERSLAEAAAGRLRPAVQRFPLANAAWAHRALETRGTMGKVVLEP